MILHKNQLLYQTNKSRPLLYLGFDRKVDNKIWAVVIEKGKPIVDWFYTTSLDYLRTDVKEPATPEGKVILFGKFKGQQINEYYDVEITEGTLLKFGDYLKALSEKYKKDKE